MNKTKRRIHWTALKGLLYDTDGDPIDVYADAVFVERMKQMRDYGVISEFFFCDPTRPHPTDDEQGWDTFNRRWAEACECGPKPAQVDFTGLED